MSQQKLLSVTPKTTHARRLQRLLLEYHEYRMSRDSHPLANVINEIGQWQIKRLKKTHRHLYEEPRYHLALDFLLEDLYSPGNFVGRDADLERIFPKMVKLVPDQALGAVANLVELNLLTQKLDEHLATMHSRQGMHNNISVASYVQSFRGCNNIAARRHQLELISATGLQLEKYVKSRLLKLSLNLTEKPAELAGLGQLHTFIQRGFKAFLAIGCVNELLDQVLSTESAIMERIFRGEADPFRLTKP